MLAALTLPDLGVLVLIVAAFAVASWGLLAVDFAEAIGKFMMLLALGVLAIVQYQVPLASAQAWPSLALL